jgi:hypothetical protein
MSILRDVLYVQTSSHAETRHVCPSECTLSLLFLSLSPFGACRSFDSRISLPS